MPPTLSRSGNVGLGGRIGRYEILGVLGAGGMGVVYRARDARMDRTVAIKTMQRDSLPSEVVDDAFLRFQREAQAVGRLSHRGVVMVHDAGFDVATQLDFIVIEHVEGVTLQEISEGRIPLPLEQLLDIVRQVAEALDHAHCRGIVHRDVKPSNILRRNDGVVKITDFGVARTDTSNLTGVGTVVGSPCYMSPEQILGEPVDGRSDQFALAVVTYELLTGRRPFEGRTLPQMAQSIVKCDPDPVIASRPELPVGISLAISQAMSRDPKHRFATCKAFVDDMIACLATARRPELRSTPTAEIRTPVAAVPAASSAPGDDANDEDPPTKPGTRAFQTAPRAAGGEQHWGTVSRRIMRARWTAPTLLAMTVASALVALAFDAPAASPYVRDDAGRDPVALAPAPTTDAKLSPDVAALPVALPTPAQRLEAARRALADGRVAEAERELTAALAADPGNELARHYLRLVLQGGSGTIAAMPELPMPGDARRSRAHAAARTDRLAPVARFERPVPAPKQSDVTVRLTHFLDAGTVTLTIDDGSVVSSPFSTDGGWGPLSLTRRASGRHEDYHFRLAEGAHRIRARLHAPGSGIDVTTSGTFAVSSDGPCTLDLRLGRLSENLAIAETCAP